MSLIRLDDVSIQFGEKPLLVGADLTIEESERVCLIGRNGAGKSTLMKIMLGSVEPDSGEIVRRQHLRVSKLEQGLPEHTERPVIEIVSEGLSAQLALLRRYQGLSARPSDPTTLREMEVLQAEIEAGIGWHPEQAVERIVSELELPSEKRLSELSGGWQRRVALGRALVSNPDLLLLDEPTNHLDIATIEWLEHEVRGYSGSVVFITHDRTFLKKLATRIVDIDRTRVRSWPGDFRNYQIRKEEADRAEDEHNALFDKRLAEEEAWIRQGIKARRTRNEGRVRALKAMREERAKRIKRAGSARIHAEEADASGRKVIEAYRISHGFHGHTLIRDFSIKVMRGDRIGLIGNNGVGKSTLLRILLGQLKPDKGSVKLGTNIEAGYFDQIRRELDPDKTIAENVGDGKDYITVNGKPRHIIGYLRNFMFEPERAMEKAGVLSGGERNRVLLAKLFTRPTNLLVLDEPTNDLDVEMLEVLEDRLVQYQGTLLVVSHDRDFLDNVVTSTLVFEPDGHVREYVGGYSDWARRNRELAVAEDEAAPTSKRRRDTDANLPPSKPGRLTYKLQYELDQLPAAIDALEREVQTLQSRVSDPKFYEAPFERTQPVLDRLVTAQSDLDQATERWLELEELRER